MTMLQATALSTPAGWFTALSDDDGVLAAGFTADPEELRRLLPATRRDTAVRAGTDHDPIGAALAAYFSGDLAALDDVPVSATGSVHQARVWAALRSLPPGAPVSYGQLAARTGSPAAARAVGRACGRNPTAVVVPCHRVVRGDGALGGFAWGVDVKRWLLDHERRHAPATRPPAGPPPTAVPRRAMPVSPPPRPPAPARTPAARPRS